MLAVACSTPRLLLPFTPHILQNGWMLKAGDKGFGKHRFLNRFFTLAKNGQRTVILSYFKSATTPARKGEGQGLVGGSLT